MKQEFFSKKFYLFIHQLRYSFHKFQFHQNLFIFLDMIRIQSCQGDHSFDQGYEINWCFEQLQTEFSTKRHETKIRTDKHSNQINDQKKFSITFRDEIYPKEGLVDVQIVDNWKIYNVNKEKKTNDDCLCFIS
ncbi:unnamed protein product [Paramecium primaurelia]|uniref:Uncharacterized protein n=1 Tax=Paramecium primaurelia TaxID=5886 RepID=A0A8S1KYN2_PARPR|nr:unnamed protein product [Paramecium primaurelia]